MQKIISILKPMLPVIAVVLALLYLISAFAPKVAPRLGLAPQPKGA